MRTINEDTSFALDGFPFARARASENLSFRDNDTSAGVHPPRSFTGVLVRRINAREGLELASGSSRARSEGLISRDGPREERS